MERMPVKADTHKEFQVYAIKVGLWDQFVEFYEGRATDEHGEPLDGVRKWLQASQGVAVADVWKIILGDSVLLIFALDTAGTDWRFISHLDDYLSHGFLHVEAQADLGIPTP